MYFPYLRGRQNELLALNELRSVLSGNSKALPIVEPVAASNYNAFKTLVRNGIPFVLIVNPTVGDLTGSRGQQLIEDRIINGSLAGSHSYHIGIIVSANTSLQEINHYLTKYPSHRKVIIHTANYSNVSGLQSLLAAHPNVDYQVFSDSRTSSSYRGNFSAYPKVLLKDGFVKAATNADYGDNDFFCDIHTSYSANGFVGFGDYLTVGDEFKVGGMTPFVVAIHLTYLDGDIYISHFLSDPSSKSRVDPAGKFSEALDSLIAFVGRQGMSGLTIGIRDFEDLHARQHYPGLGQIKKHSMKHHIEFIVSQI